MNSQEAQSANVIVTDTAEPVLRRPQAPRPQPAVREKSASLGFGDKLWAAAEVLRNNVDPAENVFWVPQVARWSFVQAHAKQPTIGMFVQSVKFIDAHGGRRNAVTVYGQESNPTTWRMARMNMAIRGIEAKLGKQHGDTFHRDQHPGETGEASRTS